MNMRGATVLFAVMLCLLQSESRAASNESISVVGAGIGGAAFSYYLKQYGCDNDIRVFEANDYIGGRINEVTFGGQLEELGADAWSPVNLYIQEIVQDLNIPLANNTGVGNGEIGIWSKDGFSSWRKILIKNTAVDACVAQHMQGFVNDLMKNYGERQAVGYFTTVNQFLQFGNMTPYIVEQFNTYLSEECGAGREYVDTMIAPIVRAIYDQTLDLHAFAGQVSLLAIFTEPLSAAQGNSQLPVAMFAASNAQVDLNSPVDLIRWDGEQYEIFYNSTGEYQKSDFVVLAAPFEKLNIEFENVEFYQTIEPRDFVFCYVTHVEATGVSPAYFGEPTVVEMPDSILTTPDSTLPFTIIGIEDMSKNVPGAKIYKIFSNEDVSDLLDSMFLNVTDQHVHKWEYTFPNLVPTTDFQPIKIAPNMYYLNTLESSVTAMEGSVIAGRNVAEWISSELNPSVQ